MSNPSEPQPLDPIALTLALWLGIIVTVTGYIRLSENAAAQASLARSAQAQKSLPATETQPLASRLMAFGG